MRPSIFRAFRRGSLAAAILALGGFAQAEPQHGIAMYGEPALPPDFVSLPYVNPDAPKGGRIVLGESGSFDSLNPHIRKGRVPWMLRFYAYESLMARSWDEPFTLYGLLAESVETDEARSWVEFTLREEARFSDGSPVTVEDVLWSYETLGTVGHPRYLGAWTKVAKAEATGPRSVRFTFSTEDRELPLILGLRPILKKAQWEGKDFTESGLTEIPISSAPYVVDDFQAGRYVSLKRNPDYWGKDLPVNRGRANVDEIRMEFFTDGTAMFEAFKAGLLTSNRETDAAKWDLQYDFPAVQSGEVVKSLIPHQRPTGIEGFVMNTRLPQFQDWRVREAMITLFNFEFINETINGGALPRISSYFSNSVLGMSHDPAEGRVAELLQPFAEDLLPGTLEGYSLPVSDGTERNRANTRRALKLFEEAGWTVQDGVMKNAQGEPFTFEILLSQGSSQHQAMIDIYAEALAKVGIVPTITTVESAQYKERTNTYDFGMTYYRRGLSLSPGNEQMAYWGSAGVTEPGSRNYMGMNSPAAEAMIETMLTSTSQDDFRAAVKALDRILTAGRYVIPIWYFNASRIAHSASLKYPEHIPMYGDWIKYQPDVWWVEE
ncbi:putative ABC transporter-binding protein precursor [Pseudoruegeria aquimaris]|uniref:Putative ABC transporter-binding protein n=1 Tax=Pseudoruegeria aquimaris TaxID=393663 RepID=A0A1Y5RI70_9RHOB|nr:extracellular solute-binding protein [Pseudoruegeria aquimaris]SLN18107.1 putative ABC transporter-binding protein precursor [Pseudoruegeria aquimaris]